MGAREYLLGFRRPTRDYRVDCLQMEAEKRISHSVKASEAHVNVDEGCSRPADPTMPHGRRTVSLFILSLLTPRLLERKRGDDYNEKKKNKQTKRELPFYYFDADAIDHLVRRIDEYKKNVLLSFCNGNCLNGSIYVKVDGRHAIYIFYRFASI